MTVRCSKCTATSEIPGISNRIASQESDEIAARSKFQRAGWKIDSQFRAVCPDCASPARRKEYLLASAPPIEAAPTLHPFVVIETPEGVFAGLRSTEPPAAPAAPRLPLVFPQTEPELPPMPTETKIARVADPEPVATAERKKKPYRRLSNRERLDCGKLFEEHLTKRGDHWFAYDEGWSDERVASEVAPEGLPPVSQGVQTLRLELYGRLVPPSPAAGKAVALEAENSALKDRVSALEAAGEMLLRRLTRLEVELGLRE